MYVGLYRIESMMDLNEAPAKKCAVYSAALFVVGVTYGENIYGNRSIF